MSNHNWKSAIMVNDTHTRRRRLMNYSLGSRRPPTVHRLYLHYNMLLSTLMLEAVQYLQPRWILLKHLTLLSTHYYLGL